MKCPICDGTRSHVFLRWANVVVMQQHLLPTEDDARKVPRGDIDLAVCHECGLIWNQAFDPARVVYSNTYDASQAVSPEFRRQLEAIAEDLVARYDLRSRDILEVGCGDAAFLQLICRLGGNRGLGYDPSWAGAQRPLSPDVRVVGDFLSAQHGLQQADGVVCRHVLEHIADPVGFLRTVATLSHVRDPLYFIEVPNVAWSLRRNAFWDIYYEHCIYFSAETLRLLLVRAGFSVLRDRDWFGGQYIWVESRYRPDAGQTTSRAAGVSALVQETARFAQSFEQQMDRLRSKLEAGAVPWGAGARAVALLNVLEISPRQVPHIVDINASKWGRHVPGTGHAIVPPDTLRNQRPDEILVLNPEYRREIEGMLTRLGLHPRVTVLGEA